VVRGFGNNALYKSTFYLLTYLLTYWVCFTGRLFNSSAGFSGLGGGMRSTECRSGLISSGTIRRLTDETKQEQNAGETDQLRHRAQRRYESIRLTWMSYRNATKRTELRIQTGRDHIRYLRPLNFEWLRGTGYRWYLHWTNPLMTQRQNAHELLTSQKFLFTTVVSSLDDKWLSDAISYAAGYAIQAVRPVWDWGPHNMSPPSASGDLSSDPGHSAWGMRMHGVR